MALHLTKIAYGCPNLADLQARLAARGDVARLSTRYRPKRDAELVGGSLYWIIAHRIVARSPIRAFEEEEGGRTAIVIDARAIPVRPVPRRAHQGWRYLAGSDAPADLGGEGTEMSETLPDALQSDLVELGLL